MHKYAFRAECWSDAIQALNQLRAATRAMKHYLISQPQPNEADVEVEFSCDLELDQVRNRLLRVEDGHTMVETVALAINYTGDRVPVQ